MRAFAPCLVALALLGPMQGCGGKSNEGAGASGPKPAAASGAMVAAASGAMAATSDTFASRFSSQRAWAHLSAQVAMGPRGHGLPGQAKLKDYIREQLTACGAEVRDMEFTFRSSRDPEPVPFVNILGTFRGESDRWVLIGTHYDTRLWADVDPDASRHDEPIEGANDGGSGTAVLLEIAAVLKERKPPVGVVIVFFDGEDYGKPGSNDYFVGSRALAQSWSKLHATKPDAAIILDMVADADLEFTREANSDQVNGWLNDHVWRAGQAVAPHAFGKGQRPVWDDHTALLEIGVPATLLIDFDYPWWHTVGDTLDKCSPESLGVTGRTVLRALLDEPVETRPTHGKPNPR